MEGSGHLKVSFVSTEIPLSIAQIALKCLDEDQKVVGIWLGNKNFSDTEAKKMRANLAKLQGARGPQEDRWALGNSLCWDLQGTWLYSILSGLLSSFPLSQTFSKSLLYPSDQIDSTLEKNCPGRTEYSCRRQDVNQSESSVGNENQSCGEYEDLESTEWQLGACVSYSVVLSLLTTVKKKVQIVWGNSGDI